MHHASISMNTNYHHFLNKQWQALVLCAKQSLNYFRIVSSGYLQNLKVRQLPKPPLRVIFKSCSKWEMTFVDSLSVTFLCGINKWFIYNILENRPDFQVLKNNRIFYQNNNYYKPRNLHYIYFFRISSKYISTHKARQYKRSPQHNNKYWAEKSQWRCSVQAHWLVCLLRQPKKLFKMS